MLRKESNWNYGACPHLAVMGERGLGVDGVAWDILCSCLSWFLCIILSEHGRKLFHLKWEPRGAHRRMWEENHVTWVSVVVGSIWWLHTPPTLNMSPYSAGEAEHYLTWHSHLTWKYCGRWGSGMKIIGSFKATGRCDRSEGRLLGWHTGLTQGEEYYEFCSLICFCLKTLSLNQFLERWWSLVIVLCKVG